MVQQSLTITQLKKLSKKIDEEIKKCEEDVKQLETERSEALKEIGNMLHESVIVSADEVRNTCYPHAVPQRLFSRDPIIVIPLYKT